jgi:hypothetical protein
MNTLNISESDILDEGFQPLRKVSCIYTYICIYIYVYTYIHMHVDLYIHVDLYVYVSICIYRSLESSLLYINVYVCLNDINAYYYSYAYYHIDDKNDDYNHRLLYTYIFVL